MAEECCSSCEVGLDDISTGNVDTLQRLSILTWAQTAPALQVYADLYQQRHPDEPKIRVVAVPSLQDLNAELNFEFQQPSGLYDGFVVPPMLVGDMYQKKDGTGLATFPKEYIDDLLPYYKYQVAMYDGAIRSLPVLAGSQFLLLFRKDYLDAMNLPTPKTWSDFVRIASLLHNEPLGEDSQPIYGSCLGRLSQEACRKRDDLSAGTLSCQSQSMAYLGMMLSSMTQVDGNSTGWMLGENDKSPMGLELLFQPTLEMILSSMEQQIKYGAPNELTEDVFVEFPILRRGTLCVDDNSRP
jgi:hypothetical protein